MIRRPEVARPEQVGAASGWGNISDAAGQGGPTRGSSERLLFVLSAAGLSPCGPNISARLSFDMWRRAPAANQHFIVMVCRIVMPGKRVSRLTAGRFPRVCAGVNENTEEADALVSRRALRSPDSPVLARLRWQGSRRTGSVGHSSGTPALRSPAK